MAGCLPNGWDIFHIDDDLIAGARIKDGESDVDPLSVEIVSLQGIVPSVIYRTRPWHLWLRLTMEWIQIAKF